MPPDLGQPLTDGFVEANPRGDRNIQTVDGALHGNTHPVIGIIGDFLPHSPAFAPENDADGAGEIDFVEAFFGLVCSRDETNSHLLEIAEGLAQVANLKKGDIFGASAGDVANRIGDPTSAFFGGDHSSHASAGTGPEAGTEIVGILNPVEDEDKGVLGRFEQAK